MFTAGNILGGVALIIVMAIVIPIALIISKKVYFLLGGDTVGIKCNHELCTKLKANITTFTSLHVNIKRDMLATNDADKNLLRKEFGDEVIRAFLSQ